MMPYKLIGLYKVNLTNEDKILFPENNITKKDLLDYYSKISKFMLPHLKDRPVMLHRFPNGIEGLSFYQKNAGKYFPKWIKQVKVPLKSDASRSGNFNNYTVCQNKASLIYLVNQGTLTFHTWLSKISKLKFPDKIVFDLDPPANGFNLVKSTAFALKKLLNTLELDAYVMTTGSAGLHVVVPIEPSSNFTIIKSFAQSCAKLLIKQFPDQLTLELRKEKRGNRVFLDTLRNQYGATSVAPYSIRAKSEAPIATPISWKELETKNIRPDKYNINNIFQRLNSTENPWKNFFKNKQPIKHALSKLKKISI